MKESAMDEVLQESVREFTKLNVIKALALEHSIKAIDARVLAPIDTYLASSGSINLSGVRVAETIKVIYFLILLST